MKVLVVNLEDLTSELFDGITTVRTGKKLLTLLGGRKTHVFDPKKFAVGACWDTRVQNLAQVIPDDSFGYVDVAQRNYAFDANATRPLEPGEKIATIH